MARSTLLVLVAAFALVGGAVLVAQSDALGPSHAPSERTRVDAPGTTVESDNDKVRIQAPGVDITVPKDKDGD